MIIIAYEKNDSDQAQRIKHSKTLKFSKIFIQLKNSGNRLKFVSRLYLVCTRNYLRSSQFIKEKKITFRIYNRKIDWNFIVGIGHKSCIH